MNLPTTEEYEFFAQYLTANDEEFEDIYAVNKPCSVTQGVNSIHEAFNQTYDELEVVVEEPLELTTEQEEKVVQTSPVENLQRFAAQIMNLPPQVQQIPYIQVPIVQQSTERKIQKQKKTYKQPNPKIDGKKLAQKKLYSTDKLRPSLPKRCGNKNCSVGQHYETPEMASLFIGSFGTVEKKNTYCPCGATIQYFLDNKWFRSGNLSKYISENKM